MDLFGIGLGELLAIGVIALLVLGPDQLPEVAATAARAVRQLRKASQELADELAREMDSSSPDLRPETKSPAPPKDEP